MNLEKHISDLLFEHDCVIIPHFGGFVCNYHSANVHASKHQFHPPFKQISFNRNLKNNDGLLANEVAQSQGISYSDSNHIIAGYVENLNKDLNLNKRIDFKSIGTIYLGEENTLLFEQDEAVNYLPDSFGLSTFNSPAIKREPIERKFEKAFRDKKVIPSKEKGDKVPATPIVAGRKTARYLLATAAVLLISFLIWVPFQSNLIKNIDYSTLNPFGPDPEPLYQSSEATALPDNDVTKENVSNMLAMASDTLRYLNIVIDGRIPIVVQLKEDATAVVKSKKKDSITKRHFHIVGGAFAISENADKFYKKLIKDGYEASIIDKKEKGLHFVSYLGFATKEEAMQAIEKIRAVQGDVWLMTN